MSEQPIPPRPIPPARMPLLPAVVLTVIVAACSVYANLAFTVTRPADYRFFPPFERGVNANMNRHLGAEYFHIAQSLAGGEGFANPFGRRTGPTAWMPPVLPTVLAGLLWVCGGNGDGVMLAVIFLQVYVLIGTGLLVLALAHRTTARAGTWAAVAVFLVALVCHFHECFQFTHDSWLVLLAIDLLVAGFCWCRPLPRRLTAAGWGLFGGLCALINPLVGLVWGVGSVLAGVRLRAWSPLAVAVLAAGLTLLPWTVRNFLVFGRLIPVKSNAAYELYQSQCLQPDGLIQRRTFAQHPLQGGSREGRQYDTLGEMAFLDQKRAQFREAVRADPVDFLDRVASRVLGTTLCYVPFDREKEPRDRPWVFLLSRATYPLPFLALLVLLFPAGGKPLQPAQWTVLGVYVLYLLPYMGLSYYERYALPLLGVKVLLVVWGADRLLSLLPRRRRQVAQGRAVRSAPVGRPGKALASVR
jgi:hypothetical protein